jgi:hypothetical protein
MAAMAYPTHTQSQACHHETPDTTAEDAIIHVLMLKESAIQKPTKFHGPHCLLASSTGSTYQRMSLSRQNLKRGESDIPGFRSSFTSINCAVLKPD